MITSPKEFNHVIRKLSDELETLANVSTLDEARKNLPQIKSRHDRLIDIANEIKRNITTLEHSLKELNEQLAQTSNSWLFTLLGIKAKKEESLIKQKADCQQQIGSYKIELTYANCVWHLDAAIPIDDLEAFIRHEESQRASTASKNKQSIKAIDYYTYLQSAEWKRKAEEAKARSGNRCQICNDSRAEVQIEAHHRTYERLGHELPDDITVLCRKCHQLYEDERRLEKPTNSNC